MKSVANRLYLSRKMGIKMSLSYKVSVFTPALLIVLITAILVFMLSFLSSLSQSIERMIIVLGIGSFSTSESVEEYLPESAASDLVVKGDGILYTENGTSIAYIKSVGSTYFSPLRERELRLNRINGEVKNPVYISKTLSDHMNIALGDRMTLMIYESDKGRARPILVTSAGIYDSGYSQLDRYMIYLVDQNISGESIYENLLPLGYNERNVLKTLDDNNISYKTYKEEYRYLYDNVKQSVAILYLIFVLVALLAAVFSADIAQVYIARDLQDIAGLSILGLSNPEIKSIYVRMTLGVVALSAALGSLIGIVLSSLSPLLMKLVASSVPELLEQYITSFNVVVPIFRIVILLLIECLVSYITLSISLSRFFNRSLVENLTP